MDRMDKDNSPSFPRSPVGMHTIEIPETICCVHFLIIPVPPDRILAKTVFSFFQVTHSPSHTKQGAGVTGGKHGLRTPKEHAAAPHD